MFTTDGDVFGGFNNFAVKREEDLFNNPNMVILSFESH